MLFTYFPTFINRKLHLFFCRATSILGVVFLFLVKNDINLKRSKACFKIQKTRDGKGLGIV